MPPVFTIQTHILPAQHIREYPRAIAGNQEDVLHLHVKEYTPCAPLDTSAGAAVTIIGAHANGFPKELYEPFWEELYHKLQNQGLNIRNIWIADVAHQGMSSVLNEDKLGNDPCWNDHARDLLLMINIQRDKMCRPLIGIGHSMGANILVNLSLIHPRLLSSLVLIDPVIHMPRSPMISTAKVNIAQLSAFRRDYWPSREDAIAFFKKSKFYQAWDRRVLDRWLESCLRETPTTLYPERSNKASAAKGITLLTPKHQEVFTFVRYIPDDVDATGKASIDGSRPSDLEAESEYTHPFYRPEPPSTFKKLLFLRPSVLYIFGGKSDLSTPELRKQKMALTGNGVGGSGGVQSGLVKEAVFHEVGHLIPMEAVDECASAAVKWLKPEIDRWVKEEEIFNKDWSQKSKREKQILSEEQKQRLGGDPRAWRVKSQL